MNTTTHTHTPHHAPDPVQWRPVGQFTVHPAVAHLPGLADTDEDFAALLADVRTHGVIQPLLVTKDNHIVDGRHRWRAAQQAGLETVPCLICHAETDAEVIGIALRTLAHRRHYTAGQVALIAYPFLRKAHHEAIASAKKAWETHKNNPARKGLGFREPLAAAPELSSTSEGANCSNSAISDRLGVSKDTFERAARLYEIFELSDDLPLQWQADILEDADLDEGAAYTARQVFWPRLMRRERPLGLGQAVAGLCGRPEIDELLNEAKRGRARKGGRPGEGDLGVTGLRKQLELFNSQWSKEIAVRSKYWSRFGDEERTRAVAAIDTGLHDAPDNFLCVLKKRIAAELKRRKAGK